MTDASSQSRSSGCGALDARLAPYWAATRFLRLSAKLVERGTDGSDCFLCLADGKCVTLTVLTALTPQHRWSCGEQLERRNPCSIQGCVC